MEFPPQEGFKSFSGKDHSPKDELLPKRVVPYCYQYENLTLTLSDEDESWGTKWYQRAMGMLLQQGSQPTILRVNTALMSRTLWLFLYQQLHVPWERRLQSL